MSEQIKFVDYVDDGSVELKCPCCSQWFMQTDADESEYRGYSRNTCDDCLAEEEGQP